MRHVLMPCLAYRTWSNCFISSAGTTSMHQDKLETNTLCLDPYVYVNFYYRNQAHSSLLKKGKVEKMILRYNFREASNLLGTLVWRNLLIKFMLLSITSSKPPTLFTTDHNNKFCGIAYTSLLELGWELVPMCFLGLQLSGNHVL